MAKYGDYSAISQAYAVDLHYEKNNRAHRTNEISIKRLIVRRGQPFSITVNFTGCEFNPMDDDYFLVAETGPKPTQSSRTKILFPVTESINVKRWSAVTESTTKTELFLIISSSPNAIIGSYNLYMCKKDSDPIVSYHLGSIVLLFNPWCSEDEVFLNSDKERKEYVMNEQGTIFVGCSSYIDNIPWNFGQFEEDILDICLKLLNNSIKYETNPVRDCMKRNNPVYICRVVSAMVNCNDDNGILCGKWNGPYSDGIYPGKWTGSIKILRQWNQSGCQPVLYGQCWVFAAVACTVLRCLGIPTRVVTNFDSAHDANGNLTIDNYYSEKFEMDDSDDSVWNFHVWVESWIARFDLRPGNEGWQVLDPTPQEKSGGIYCCGPAPVKAIKEADFDVGYDVPFVFSEVNADVVKWLCLTEESKKVKMDVKSASVGCFISTKSVGSDEREDITNNYKYAEGSTAERQITERAHLSKRHMNVQKERLLYLNLNVNTPVYNGSTVKVFVKVSNKSADDRVYTLKFCAKKKRYNGTYEKQNLKVEHKEISIKSKKGKETSRNFFFVQCRKLQDQTLNTCLRNNCNAQIVLQVQEFPLLNHKVKAEISFKNPLPVPLNDCVFTLEGAGLIEGEMQLKVNKVNAGETAKVKAQFTPKKSGERKLSLDFDSDKIRNVKGSKIIDIPCHL
uniref:Protein-glutamine gamma-glutamyltransferase 2 n=1 Tax=Callorhinchus milii TaxID=7868 RepID=A0A4W3J396_CALMI